MFIEKNKHCGYDTENWNQKINEKNQQQKKHTYTPNNIGEKKKLPWYFSLWCNRKNQRQKLYIKWITMQNNRSKFKTRAKTERWCRKVCCAGDGFCFFYNFFSVFPDTNGWNSEGTCLVGIAGLQAAKKPEIFKYL